MREITKLMVYKYNMMNLHYDFMGYAFDKKNELSFHHLIIPKRLCQRKKLGDGYTESNGAILVQDTAHNYLHIVEQYDRELFDGITNEMIQENLSGKIRMENLERINILLEYFEKECDGFKNRNGETLIKEKYKQRILKK